MIRLSRLNVGVTANILERWEKRHQNFVRSNAHDISIRHTETHTTSEGRKIPVRQTFRSRNAPTKSWQAKAKLYHHLPFSFFSDVNSQHEPSRPDQRRAGELEDEYDAHVGPIPQTNYTRSGDYFMQVRNAVEGATREARNIKVAFLANTHNINTVI